MFDSEELMDNASSVSAVFDALTDCVQHQREEGEGDLRTTLHYIGMAKRRAGEIEGAVKASHKIATP